MGDLIISNSSTHGVACEVQFNKDLTCAYLCGDEDQIYLPDPNHASGTCGISLVEDPHQQVLEDMSLILRY